MFPRERIFCLGSLSMRALRVRIWVLGPWAPGGRARKRARDLERLGEALDDAVQLVQRVAQPRDLGVRERLRRLRLPHRVEQAYA